MADDSDKDVIQHQGVLYIKLGNLLAKTRDKSDQEKVAQIVESNLTLDDKIKQIETLDSATKSNDRPKIYIMDSGNVLKQTGPSSQLLKIRKNRGTIKKDITPGAWIAYFFRERLRLSGLRRCEPFLRYGFWAPRFDVNPLTQLQTRLRAVSLPVLTLATDSVLKDGWKYLSKTEYNLIAALGVVLLELKRCNYAPKQEDLKNQSLYWALESSWLFFHAVPDYIQRTGVALERMMELDPALSSRKAEIKQLFGELLAVRTAGINVASFILAINIYRSRRYLVLEDLIDTAHGPFVASEDFDCSEETRTAINNDIGQTCQRLDEVNTKILDIIKLRNFLPMDETNEPDYSDLLSFAGISGGMNDSSKSTKLPDETTKMVDNTINFISHLCGLFLRQAEPLFLKFRKLAEQRQSGAADRNNPDYEAAKLRSLRDKLDQLMSTLPHLPRVRFQSLKNSGQNASRYEIEALSMLTEASEMFLRYGQKLSHLLAETPPPKFETKPEPQKESNQTGASQLPVPDASLLESLADRDAMIRIIRCLYLAAAWLQNNDIMEAMHQERLYTQERKSLAFKLERLCNKAQWQQLNEQYKLADYLH
ncbi:MAG: hypothetical protein KKI09_10960 [Spirochaetes bacterium]|nr:hypothetical protein [Spirochaetota bacterium]MBU0955935.1 hypothetical protein [Spirochaetota bacterium]